MDIHARPITLHQVSITDQQIGILALGPYAPAGAQNHYRIQLGEPGNRPPVHIHFQAGNPAEVGVNGVTLEALMAVCIDRLTRFQAGPFACYRNSMALNHLQIALDHLQERSRTRRGLGIEGKQE